MDSVQFVATPVGECSDAVYNLQRAAKREDRFNFVNHVGESLFGT